MFESALALLQSLKIEFGAYATLEWFCDMVEDEIKSFTHLQELPKELNKVGAYRAVGRVLSDLKSSGKLDEVAIERTVKSISEGDTSITYALTDSDSAETRFSAMIDGMKGYGMDILRSHRRLRW